MKKLLPVFVKFVSFVAGIAFVVILTSYSFMAMKHVFPSSLSAQVMGVVMFDIATVVWFLRIIGEAETKAQYVYAGIGFVVGFVLTVWLVNIEFGISAGIPAENYMRDLVNALTWATVAHVGLLYLYELSGTGNTQRLKTGIHKAEIFDDAMRQSEIAIEQSKQALGSVLHGQYMRELMNDLHINASEKQLEDLFGESVVITEKQDKKGFFDSMKNALGIGVQDELLESANSESPKVENGGTK